MATTGGDALLVDLLLDAGIGINQQDAEGNTAILLSYLSTQAELAVALMRRGAALWTINNERICVLDEILEEYDALYPGRRALQRRLLGN